MKIAACAYSRKAADDIYTCLFPYCPYTKTGDPYCDRRSPEKLPENPPWGKSDVADKIAAEPVPEDAKIPTFKPFDKPSLTKYPWAEWHEFIFTEVLKKKRMPESVSKILGCTPQALQRYIDRYEEDAT